MLPQYFLYLRTVFLATDLIGANKKWSKTGVKGCMHIKG